jgi:hypothetical protein
MTKGATVPVSIELAVVSFFAIELQPEREKAHSKIDKPQT